MLHIIENAKLLPDGHYEARLLSRDEKPEDSDGETSYFLETIHPKMRILFVKRTEKDLFGYNSVENG